MMGSFNHPSAGLEHSNPYGYGPPPRSYPMRTTSASMIEMERLRQILRSGNSSAQDRWDNPTPGTLSQAAMRYRSPPPTTHPQANATNTALAYHLNDAFNTQPTAETHNNTAFGAQLDEIARARQGLGLDQEESQIARARQGLVSDQAESRKAHGDRAALIFAAILNTTWMRIFLEALSRASG